jgi:hypothetical protein
MIWYRELWKSLTAGEITKIALNMLEDRNCEVWRQNNIRVPGRAFIGRKGIPDIIGYHRVTGVFIACEVKTELDRLSDAQVEFLMGVKKSGGFAITAQQGKDGFLTICEYLPD